MKRHSIVVLLLSILSLTGCGKLTFQDFSAPDGSFSVKMPGTPVRKSIGPGSDTYEVVTGRWSFEVDHIHPPPGGIDPGLDGFISAFASNLRATSRGNASVNLNGFSGREIEMSLPAGPNPTSGKQEPASTVVGRIYKVNDTYVMVLARCVSNINKDSADVKTFLDSFKMTATASTTPGHMASNSGNSSSQPGGFQPPPGTGAMPPGPGSPGTPPGNYPPAGYPPAGYPTAGTTPGTYPMPNGANPMPGGYPTAPPGTYPNAPGTTPMPGAYPPGGYPNPNGINPNVAGTTPMTPGTYPPPPGTNPMPNGNYGKPPANYPGTAPGGFKPPNTPASEPTFTGTPVADDTKLNVGDVLQVFAFDQWHDVKIVKVMPNGLVQVRTVKKPFIQDSFQRSRLQFPPGADSPEVASNDTPRTDPSGLPSSGSFNLPNSKGSGLPNSKSGTTKPKSGGFTTNYDSESPKPRSSGFTNPDSDKPAKSKSSGFTNSTASTPKSTPKTTPKADSGGKPSLGAISIESASVDELLQIIAKKTEHRRVQAAERLKGHNEAGPNPEVAKKLVDLLQADQLTVRNAVAQALEKWACPEINAAVLKNLSGGTTEVRQSMMRIAAANSIEGSIPLIVKCLPNIDDRKVATEVVLSIGAPAEGEVIKLLDNRDGKVRQAARDILQEIGSADSITALTKRNEKWSGSERASARKTIKALEAKK